MRGIFKRGKNALQKDALTTQENIAKADGVLS
jgi:hypothetical protein